MILSKITKGKKTLLSQCMSIVLALICMLTCFYPAFLPLDVQSASTSITISNGTISEYISVLYDNFPIVTVSSHIYNSLNDKTKKCTNKAGKKDYDLYTEKGYDFATFNFTDFLQMQYDKGKNSFVAFSSLYIDYACFYLTFLSDLQNNATFSLTYLPDGSSDNKSNCVTISNIDADVLSSKITVDLGRLIKFCVDKEINPNLLSTNASLDATTGGTSRRSDFYKVFSKYPSSLSTLMNKADNKVTIYMDAKSYSYMELLNLKKEDGNSVFKTPTNVGTESEEETAKTRTRILMSGDFSNADFTTTLHEHYRWKQFDGLSGGVCGEQSAIKQSCWNNDAVTGIAHNSACYAVSTCMLAYDAGAVSLDFTPYDWFTSSNSGIGADASVNSLDYFSPKLKKLQYMGDYYMSYSSNLTVSTSETEIVTKITNILEDDTKYIIFWSNNGGNHAVYCMGTAINPSTQQSDFVICDPGRGTSNMFAKGGDICMYGGCFDSYALFQSYNCTPYYNGMSPSDTLSILERGATSTGGLFADEEEIVIPSMQIILNSLTNEDLRAIQIIKDELESGTEIRMNSMLVHFSKAVGMLLMFYELIFLLAFVLSYYGAFSDVGLLRLVTFNTFDEAVITYDSDYCTNRTLSLRKALLMFLLGMVLSSFLLFPNELIGFLMNLFNFWQKKVNFNI